MQKMSNFAVRKRSIKKGIKIYKKHGKSQIVIEENPSDRRKTFTQPLLCQSNARGSQKLQGINKQS